MYISNRFLGDAALESMVNHLNDVTLLISFFLDYIEKKKRDNEIQEQTRAKLG